MKEPEKKYLTHDGVPCTLEYLIRTEPTWAARRIREGEEVAKELKKCKAHLYEIYTKGFVKILP